MKLVSLNTWGGTQGQGFFDFIKEQAKSADIFCFQEIFTAGSGAPQINNGWHMFLLEELKHLLPDFLVYFEVKSSGYADDSEKTVSWPVEHGLAVFFRKKLKVENYDAAQITESLVLDTPPVEGPVKVQILTFSQEGKNFHVLNTHGLSRPGDKLDTPDRIQQSENLLNLINRLPKHPFILCGDFNLMPDTQSIKMIEQTGMKNLIKDFNITNTRNEITWNKYANKQSYADFAFTSADIKIKDFQVPYNLVSDHLPMILDFEILN